MMSLEHLTQGSALPPLKPGVLRLYSMHYCPFAQRTRLVLEHKKIPYETVNINTKVKPEWFTDKNPLALVPVLEQDDKIVYESAICDEYLDNRYPDNGSSLLPKDPYERARMQILMEAASKFVSLFFGMVRSSPEDRDKALKTLKTQMMVFENALTKTYLGGDSPGMIDLHIWPFVERFCFVKALMDIDIITATEFPRLDTWVAAMMDLPAVKATINKTEHHVEFTKAYAEGRVPDYDMHMK